MILYQFISDEYHMIANRIIPFLLLACRHRLGRRLSVVQAQHSTPLTKEYHRLHSREQFNSTSNMADGSHEASSSSTYSSRLITSLLNGFVASLLHYFIVCSSIMYI